MEQLKTERLWIRPIQSDDVEAIHEYASDKGITMMLFLPSETIEETKEFVSYAVSQWTHVDPDDREFVLVMGDKIVGGMTLVDDQGTRTYAKTGVTSGEYTYAMERD